MRLSQRLRPVTVRSTFRRKATVFYAILRRRLTVLGSNNITTISESYTEIYRFFGMKFAYNGLFHGAASMRVLIFVRFLVIGKNSEAAQFSEKNK